MAANESSGCSNLTGLNVTEAVSAALEQYVQQNDGNPVADGSGFMFGLFALFMGMAVRSVLRLVPANYYRPPFTVLMFLLGAYMEHADVGFLHESLQAWKGLHPHFILYLLVPPLLFESSFNVEWHVFQNVLPSSMLLAGPGVMAASVLTAAFVKPMVNAFVPSFSWNAAFLVGAIVSATDPVAVVALLKELGAPMRLAMLVEGESLLNDASAVMLFLIFAEMLRDESLSMGPLDFISRFLYLSFGATVWGGAMGYFTFLWLKHFRDVTIGITCLIVGVFVTFFVGEHTLHVSGILSLVVYGLFLARNKTFAMTQHELDENQGVWEEAAFVSNTMIFVLSGVIVADRISNNDTFNHHHSGATAMTFVWLSVALYILCLGIRALMMVCLYPLMKHMGYGFSLKEAIMLTFSGLRGAISLSLALIVERDPEIGDTVCLAADVVVPDEIVNCREAQETRDVVLILVSGVVALSLVLNGSAAGWVYDMLNIYPENGSAARIQSKAVQKLMAEFEKTISEDRVHWLHRKADMVVVRQLLPEWHALELGRDAKSKIRWPMPSMSKAWADHLSRYDEMNEDEIVEALRDESKLAGGTADEVDDAEVDPYSEQAHSTTGMAKVAPEVLRNFSFKGTDGFDILDESMVDVSNMSETDRKIHDFRVAENVGAIYTVIMGAVESSFMTERHTHLISRRCLGSLQVCLGAGKNTLLKNNVLTECALKSFWAAVKDMIEKGEHSTSVSMMSHFLFDHLLKCTEMLFAVISVFRDLHEVTLKIQLPGWAASEKRLNESITFIYQDAFQTLDELYINHARLMVTVHTVLATRHNYHLLGSKIHEYKEAGLLSDTFDEQTRTIFRQQLDDIREYFDINPLKRLCLTIKERFNVMCQGKDMADAHPVVDSSFYRDESKSAKLVRLATKKELNEDGSTRASPKTVAKSGVNFVNPTKRTTKVAKGRMSSSDEGLSSGRESGRASVTSMNTPNPLMDDTE